MPPRLPFPIRRFRLSKITSLILIAIFLSVFSYISFRQTWPVGHVHHHKAQIDIQKSISRSISQAISKKFNHKSIDNHQSIAPDSDFAQNFEPAYGDLNRDQDIDSQDDEIFTSPAPDPDSKIRPGSKASPSDSVKSIKLTDILSLIKALRDADLQLVILDPKMFHPDFILWNYTAPSDQTQPNRVISFGLFETDHQKFKQFCDDQLDPNRVISARGIDYRKMRNKKSKSIYKEIITHYFIFLDPSLSASAMILHIALIFPRRRYFWIGDLQESIIPPQYRYLVHLDYPIPMPMAIEAFECQVYYLKLTDQDHSGSMPDIGDHKNHTPITGNPISPDQISTADDGKSITSKTIAKGADKDSTNSDHITKNGNLKSITSNQMAKTGDQKSIGSNQMAKTGDQKSIDSDQATKNSDQKSINTDHKGKNGDKISINSDRVAKHPDQSINTDQKSINAIQNSISVCAPSDIDFYSWQLPRSKFHECHFNDIVYPFRSKFPQMGQLNDTIDQAEALGEIMRITKSNRISTVITCGTLLGWYRQCDYIVESKDIDVGLKVEEYKYDFFKQLFESRTLNLVLRYGTVDIGLEFRTHTKKNVWLDVFLIYQIKPNQSASYMWSNRYWYETTYPIQKGICSAELFGVLTFIPCNYAEFVTADYGRHGWFVPNVGPRYANINMAYKKEFEEKEAPFMEYRYKKGGCERPDELWGCDPMPEEVVKSSLYQEWLKKQRGHST